MIFANMRFRVARLLVFTDEELYVFEVVFILIFIRKWWVNINFKFWVIFWRSVFESRHVLGIFAYGIRAKDSILEYRVLLHSILLRVRGSPGSIVEAACSHFSYRSALSWLIILERLVYLRHGLLTNSHTWIRILISIELRWVLGSNFISINLRLLLVVLIWLRLNLMAMTYVNHAFIHQIWHWVGAGDVLVLSLKLID